ncbi:MAG: penicillin-binding protein 2 [Propionibacteriaceae bacterium]|nr:penicillin-binding protein 2 [Propionibacteriaceae bacterium]
MNGPLRKVSIFVACMMAALLINLTVLITVRQPGLLDHQLNRRVRDAEFSRDRGAILVGNDPIAISEDTGNAIVPFKRSYNDGRLWAPVTGWFTRIHGASGLELSYARDLAGTASRQTFNRIVDVVTGKEPAGANISTTLNPDAQRAAMEGLGDARGAVVALNYETGEVLALASTPSYDPNELSGLDTSKASKRWNQLLNAPEEPLKNRAVREVYPPGSTFKLVTAAAALENGISPDTEIPSPSSLRLPGSNHSVGNSTNCGGETTTLENALATSCNTAFGQVGLDLGADKLKDVAERFGFNKDSQIDIQAARSRYPQDADKAQTALSAIGQFDVASSPLQMAQVVAAIANNGKMMKPYIVKDVMTRDLQVLSSTKPTVQSTPISEATAKQLQQMMQTVVQEGTGRSARIDGVTLGGKTGTAQTSKERNPYAWFVGYADDPKVAVAVFIEDAGVARDDISGGRLAAPIFRSVVQALR